GVLLPASALFLDRPMPPARALVDAGAAIAIATDFNPGGSFCESLAIVSSLAATQLQLTPAQALSACTVNAAFVLGVAGDVGRIAPGYAADLVLLDAPDWRHLAYHLGGDLVATVIEGGEVTWSRAAERSEPNRARLFLPLFFIVFSLVNKKTAIEWRFLSSLAYSALFVPLTYVMDRTAYRTYLRRSGQQPAAKR